MATRSSDVHFENGAKLSDSPPPGFHEKVEKAWDERLFTKWSVMEVKNSSQKWETVHVVLRKNTVYVSREDPTRLKDNVKGYGGDVTGNFNLARTFVLGARSSDTHRFAFKLCKHSKNKKGSEETNKHRSAIFCAKTAEERNDWMRLCKDGIIASWEPAVALEHLRAHSENELDKCDKGGHPKKSLESLSNSIDIYCEYANEFERQRKLAAPGNVQKISRVQSAVRRWLTKRKVNEVSSPPSRDKAFGETFKEFLESEQEYHDTLKLLEKRFLIPAESIKEGGEPVLRQFALFEHVLELLRNSNRVIILLQSTIQVLERTRVEEIPVGSIFHDVIFNDKTNHYLPYLESYAKQFSTFMSKAKKISGLRKLIKKLESEKDGNERLVLSSTLLLPMERLSKYLFYAKSFLQIMLPDDRDFHKMKEVVTRAERLILTTEDVREVASKVERVMSLHSTFSNHGPDLFDTTHTMIREGPVMLLQDNGLERSYLYLLNDAIIIASLSSDFSKRFERMLKLEHCVAFDIEDGTIRNGFGVSSQQPKKSYQMCCSTSRESKSWTLDINEAVYALRLAHSQLTRPQSKRDLKSQRGSQLTETFQMALDAGLHKTDLPVWPSAVRSPVRTGAVLLGEMEGPDSPSCPAVFVAHDTRLASLCCGLTVSTYPRMSPDSDAKLGDPIADHWVAKVYDTGVCACITDGCNWGTRPQRAAQRAAAAFVDYLVRQIQADPIGVELFSLNVDLVATRLLLAANAAHKSTVKGFEEDLTEAGTTTILGGMLTEIDNTHPGEPSKWAFICISIGDCKAFHFSCKSGKVTDITFRNRGNLADASDPGGRIGPQIGQAEPDLRNLKVYLHCIPDEGDIIFLVSDGVHDNFDPQQLGKLPQEVDPTLDLVPWKVLEGDTRAQQAKDQFRVDLMSKVIMGSLPPGSVTPQSLTNNLIRQCEIVTQTCRDFMEQNPGAKQPSDYTSYPGKFDHSTCLAFVVGKPHS